MKYARFYCENIDTGLTAITGSELHHLTKVLRLNVGDEVELFDGRGIKASAVITEISKASAKLKIRQSQAQKPRATGRIIIAVSVAKGSRFDWLISKCVELGVDRVMPVIFERTVKLAKGEQANERYNKLAIEAARQCGRMFLPKIDAPCSLAECVENLKEDYPKGLVLFGSLAKGAKSIIDCDIADNDMTAFIGPEGGMTEQEEKLLIDNGAIGVRLTETILRVETAALAFAAVLTAKRDFSG